MSKALVVASNRGEDLMFGKKIAETLGVPMIHARDFNQVADILDQGGCLCVLVDATNPSQLQGFENTLQSRLGLFSDKVNSNLIHFIGTDELEQTRSFIQSPLFGSYIVRNSEKPEEAGLHYSRVIRAFQSETAFGLGRYFNTEAKIQVVKLESSTQKQDAVEAVKNYVVSAKFPTRSASMIANAVDEFIMNAIYDAPTDTLGRQLHAKTARNTPIELSGKSTVEMHIGFDGQYLGISVVDFFGSLDKAKLLSQMTKSYQNEEYKLKTSTVSAGIGLATVFKSSAGMVFISESRVRTEVTIFYKKTDNFKNFRDQPRFIATQFYF